ncbi:MAG: HepT-like ribonuclease domain-containing protein [Candidatus Heimdallarchaeaceae archaeon]
MKDDIALLKHILDECKFLIEYIKQLTFEDFFSSEVHKRAAVRSIEIIGEASKKVSEKTRIENTQIEWNELAKMRDVLIHQYFGIDYEIVWDVIKEKIPKLFFLGTAFIYTSVFI